VGPDSLFYLNLNSFVNPASMGSRGTESEAGNCSTCALHGLLG
jgi:hypothetical protein